MGPRAGTKIFYGWFIVGLAFSANFMSVGTGFYMFNVFLKPMTDLHQWSRTEANLALMYATVAGAAGQIIYGTLLLRVGPRPLMVIGSIIAGLAFAALGRIERLETFYLFYVLLFLGNGAYGGIVANTAVNNWFIRKRGRAMGLATMGTSLSGAVLPFLALALLSRMDLAAACAWIGGAIVVMAPLALLLMRNRPEDYGQWPDGIKPEREIDHGNRLLSRAELWKPRQIVRTGAFYRAGLAYGMVLMGIVGVMSQLATHFTDLNYSERDATLIMGATAFLGSLGKVFWGALCDRFAAKRVAATLFLGGAAGLGLIFFQDHRLALLLFIIVFGFAMGGVTSTFPVLIAELYGRASFASVARLLALFFVLEISGYYIVGRSFDLTGSYSTAYAIFIALDLGAAALILSVRKPERRKA